MITDELELIREQLRAIRRLPEGERRRAGTQATIERYRNKAFDWATGITCVHLARTQLRNMGHRPPSLPRFRSALGAKKAMKERGWGSVSGMLDSLLPRIAPAQMQLGDLAVLPGDDGFDAIFICAGPRRVFGWREDQPMAVMLGIKMDDVTAAWRV